MSTMFTLRAEIAACLVAVAVLGLLAGWMMQRGRSSRQHDRLTRSWHERYTELEASARQDEQNLEERLQSLAAETRALTSENRALREAARERDESSGGARAEAIEQNRRQAETQERLQRIIREREREIATLRSSLEARGEAMQRPRIAALERHGRETPASSGAEALDETIRIDPAQLPDASAREAANERMPAGGRQGSSPMADGPPVAELPTTRVDTPNREGDSDQLDESLDSTMEVTMLDTEEATVALDDEALALVREFGRGGQTR